MRKLLPFLLLLSLPIQNLFAQCTTPGDVTITGPGITNNTVTGGGCTDRVATYTVSATGANDYEWNITGTNSITRKSATEYTVVFENNNVTIEVTPKSGACSGTKKTVTINVTQTPSKPFIVQTGNELDAGVTASSYQWYSNSSPITGATARTYSPASNGVYLVEAKNGNGCSSYSANFNFFRTAIREDAIFSNFSFYPNPVTTQLFVNFNKPFEVSFLNLSGQETLQKTDLQGKQEIDLSSLKRGLYLMKITSDGKTAVRKLLLK